VRLKTNSFCRHRIGFKVLMKMDFKTDKWKRERPMARIVMLSCLKFLFLSFLLILFEVLMKMASKNDK